MHPQAKVLHQALHDQKMKVMVSNRLSVQAQRFLGENLPVVKVARTRPLKDTLLEPHHSVVLVLSTSWTKKVDFLTLFLHFSGDSLTMRGKDSAGPVFAKSPHIVRSLYQKQGLSFLFNKRDNGLHNILQISKTIRMAHCLVEPTMTDMAMLEGQMGIGRWFLSSPAPSPVFAVEKKSVEGPTYYPDWAKLLTS